MIENAVFNFASLKVIFGMVGMVNDKISEFFQNFEFHCKLWNILRLLKDFSEMFAVLNDNVSDVIQNYDSFCEQWDIWYLWKNIFLKWLQWLMIKSHISSKFWIL